MGNAEAHLAKNTVKRSKRMNHAKMVYNEIMKEYDTSRTGTLSRNEVKVMAARILGSVAPAMGGLEYEEIELIMCLGGNNTRPEINAEELPQALAIISTIKEENEDLEDLFHKHDIDKSGELPAAQLKSLLTEVNGGVAPSDDDVTYVLKQCEPRGVADPIKKTQLKAAICCWCCCSAEDIAKSIAEEREKVEVAEAKAAEEKRRTSAEQNVKGAKAKANEGATEGIKKLEMPKIKAREDDKLGNLGDSMNRQCSRAEELSLDEGNRRRAADQDENACIPSPRRPPPVLSISPRANGTADGEIIPSQEKVAPVCKAVSSNHNDRTGARCDVKEPKVPNTAEPTNRVFQPFLFGSCRLCCRSESEGNDVADAEAPVLYDNT